MNLLGIRFNEGRVIIDPVLPPEWDETEIRLKTPLGRYKIHIKKPKGFMRSADTDYVIKLNGQSVGKELPAVEGSGEAVVDVLFSAVSDRGCPR